MELLATIRHYVTFILTDMWLCCPVIPSWNRFWTRWSDIVRNRRQCKDFHWGAHIRAPPSRHCIFRDFISLEMCCWGHSDENISTCRLRWLWYTQWVNEVRPNSIWRGITERPLQGASRCEGLKQLAPISVTSCCGAHFRCSTRETLSLLIYPAAPLLALLLAAHFQLFSK